MSLRSVLKALQGNVCHVFHQKGDERNIGKLLFRHQDGSIIIKQIINTIIFACHCNKHNDPVSNEQFEIIEIVQRMISQLKHFLIDIFKAPIEFT